MGFEPTTFWSEAKCASPLRYARSYSSEVKNDFLLFNYHSRHRNRCMATLIQRQWFYHSSSKERIYLISLLKSHSSSSFKEFTILMMHPKIKSKTTCFLSHLDKSLGFPSKSQEFYRRMSKAFLSTFLLAFHISDSIIHPQALAFIDKFYNSTNIMDLHASWISFYKLFLNWQLQDKQQVTIQLTDELSKLNAFKESISLTDNPNESNEWNVEISKIEIQLSNYLYLLDKNPQNQNPQTNNKNENQSQNQNPQNSDNQNHKDSENKFKKKEIKSQNQNHFLSTDQNIDSIQFLHDLYLDGNNENWYQRLANNYSSLQSFDKLIQNLIIQSNQVNDKRELLFVLLVIAKEQLLDLVKKNGHYYKIITESLPDLESITFENGNENENEKQDPPNGTTFLQKSFSIEQYSNFFDFILEISSQLCSPSRDNLIQNTKKEIQEGIREDEGKKKEKQGEIIEIPLLADTDPIKKPLKIIKILHLMHQDSIQHYIRTISTSLPMTIIQRERMKFAEIIKGKELIHLKNSLFPPLQSKLKLSKESFKESLKEIKENNQEKIKEIKEKEEIKRNDLDLKNRFIAMIIDYLNVNNENTEKLFESNELFLWDKTRFKGYRREIDEIIMESKKSLLKNSVTIDSQLMVKRDSLYNLLNARLLKLIENSLREQWERQDFNKMANQRNCNQRNNNQNVKIDQLQSAVTIDKMGFPINVLERINQLQSNLKRWKCHHLNVFSPIYNNLATMIVDDCSFSDSVLNASFDAFDTGSNNENSNIEMTLLP